VHPAAQQHNTGNGKNNDWLNSVPIVCQSRISIEHRYGVACDNECPETDEVAHDQCHDTDEHGDRDEHATRTSLPPMP
jgi:hypothetical protein